MSVCSHISLAIIIPHIFDLSVLLFDKGSNLYAYEH